MAVAGLHSVSVFDSSFLRESASQPSRQRADEGMPVSQASSTLKMWRELEDEHGLSGAEARVRRLRQQGSHRFTENTSESQTNEQSGVSDDGGEDDSECETWSDSQIGTQNENDDCGHSSSEQTPGFGEVERGRVRHIFREWMNCGGSRHTSDVSQMNNSSSARWLGDKECERVRIVREWVQMNSQERGDGREEPGAEIGSQLEKIRDGLILNQGEGTSGYVHRRICRLRGRQALLDILAKAERERQREIQNLLEHHAVSNFSHRNRIQSLLRGRFLRNERLSEDQKTTTIAAGELGVLRQRRTVSGLREGFLSRLDTSAHDQGSINHCDSSSGDIDANGNGEAQRNSSQEICDESNGLCGSTKVESDISGLLCQMDKIEGNSIERTSMQSSAAHVHAEDRNGQASDNEERNRPQATYVEELLMTPPNSQENMEGVRQENTTNGRSEEISEDNGGEYSLMHVPVGVSHIEPSGEVCDFLRVSDSDNHLEDNLVEDRNWQESAAEDFHERQLTDGEESDQRQLSNVSTGSWRNIIGGELGGSLQINSIDRSGQDITGNGSAELFLPESREMWHDDGNDEAVDGQSEGPSEWVSLPVPSADTFFSSDDNNMASLELRELLSRRSVSSLLQSDFRENLDRLVQSYVERQAHASMDWDIDGMSSSLASEVHDQEQQSGNQNEGLVDTVQSPLLRTQLNAPQPLWDQDNWSRHNMHQSLELEWDIVNDLRIDITRLQHRMDNMQRLLEACMDMQLELQRSIRQEVSAALNRARSPEFSDASLADDGSKWDHVKKGICCICCDSNIDSLLYRCGHMCTCTNCASELVEGRGKCPMCHAPVIEVIRTYSTH